jgi:hypothetical protein
MSSFIQSLKTNWQTTLLLALLLWMVGTAAYRGALNPESGLTGIDYALYHRAAGWLNAGEPLYYPGDPSRMGYMYAPFVAWALRPLAALPMEKALQAWFLINAAALVLAVVFYAIATRLRWEHAAALGILLIVGFRFWPTTCSFGLGQINCVLLALVAGALLADSRDKMSLVAVLIAGAALIKLWMMAAVIHLAVRRAWGAIALCFTALAAMLAGSFALVGWQEWPGFVATITSESASVQSGLVSQSIPGFARLRFSDLGLVEPFSISPLAQYAFVAIGYLVVGFGLAWLWWSGGARTPYEARMRFSFAVLSMLLLLPLCHMEYFVFALPLLWTLFVPDPGSRVRLTTVLAAFLLYFALTRPVPVSGPGLAAHRSGLQSFLVSLPFFAGCGLWLVSLVEIYRARREALAAPERAPAAGAPPAALVAA